MYPVEFRLFRLNEKGWNGTTRPPAKMKVGKFIVEPEATSQSVQLRIELVNHASQILNASLAIMTGDFGFSFLAKIPDE